jgi:hypothetical protein
MSQTLYIILGFVILIISNFLVTLALVSFYFYLAKVKEPLVYVLKLAALLAASNLLTQFLALLIFSGNGIMIYATVAFILSLLGYFGVLKLGYKYHILENAILAGSLSIIFNPIWLKIFGIVL